MKTYADFWSEMIHLDMHTLVLEPSHPSPADCRRRIALARHASVELEIDPLKPRHIPRCRLIGPER
jgi:E3 ubiquitin-protein ligase FANCL